MNIKDARPTVHKKTLMVETGRKLMLYKGHIVVTFHCPVCLATHSILVREIDEMPETPTCGVDNGN